MVPLVSSVISCQATAGFKSRVEHKCYFKAWFPFSPPPQDTNTQSANQCQLWEWGWKLSVSCDSVMSESTRTHGAHQTYQHPHDIRPQLGKTVGGSSAFCPWLIRSCTGPLISLHCVWRSNLCSVSLIGWKGLNPSPRITSPDCEVSVPQTKLSLTHRWEDPTFLGTIRTSVRKFRLDMFTNVPR